MSKNSYLTVTDQFCGAGGSSQGVRQGKIPKLEDCFYRMLLPHEVKLGMAFDADYVVKGNSKEQVKQCGNAVTPPVMKDLVQRCVETLK
jgi:DNA (cytosine-5)-methyltransferase 1